MSRTTFVKGLFLFAAAGFLNIEAVENETVMNWQKRNREIPEMEMQVCCDDPCRRYQPRLDILVWQADEDGLEYGTKMEATPIIGVASSTRTELLDLDFDWDPGFLLGFGYLISDFDSWAIDVNWTHIHNHAHGRTTSEGIEGQTTLVDTIVPTWVNLLFELRFGASLASAHWDLHYDTLDFELRKSICLSERLLLKPHFGVRGAWIDQHYKAKYDTLLLLAADSTPFPRLVTFIGDTDFKAAGLRGGSEVVCRLTTEWHLFSQFSANILYGKFEVHMKNLNDQSLGEGGVLPSPMNFFASEHFKRIRLNFEEAVGFGWERLFRCEKYRLCLRAAFEMSQWLQQNELFTTFYFRGQDTISSFPVRSQGDLSFMGVRLSGQFDF